MIECLNKERQRARVVGLFPNEQALLKLSVPSSAKSPKTWKLDATKSRCKANDRTSALH
jgi:transposase-like protein